jgi:hypothetical protein
MEQIGKNFTTPGQNFDVDKQYDLDFDFANQLVDTLEKINKEYPEAKLTVEDISNYDGKHFTVVGRKKTFNEEELRLWAQEKNDKATQIQREETIKNYERLRQDEQDEADWEKNNFNNK